jgi:hypothetical protein
VVHQTIRYFFLSMILFAAVGLILADEPSNLKVYSCHRKSEVYLNDSLIGIRNVKLNIQPGIYQVTVKYRGNSITQTIEMRDGHRLRHTQVASPTTLGIGVEGIYIHHPLFDNFGISLNPSLTIRDRNILGFSIAYHNETFLIIAPSALNFQYYHLLNPIYKNQSIGLGAKLGLMITGRRYPDTIFPDDMNLFYFAPSLMYQIGKRPFQIRITVDVLIGTRKYIIFDPNSTPIFTAAFRSAAGFYIDL